MSLSDMTTHPAYLCIKSAVAAFTILGNTFIVFTILRCQKLRNEKFNLLIILLAMGDMVIGINVPFSLSLAFISEESVWRPLFLTSQVLVTFGDHVTQIAMLLIAADRMHVLFTLHKLDRNALYTVYAASIPVVLAISLLPVCFFLVESSTVIAAIQGTIDAYSSTFVYYMTVIMFVFNFSIIGLYGAVAIKYTAQIKQTSVASSAQASFNRIVIGIVVVYFLMWCIPKWLNFGIVTGKVQGLVFDIALILPEECELLSAAVNVFVYGFTHRDLRNEMKRYLNKVTRTKVLTVSVHSWTRQVTTVTTHRQ
ncbi:hypothetical protein QR680_013494 [Steinernema hermaphroditum]|uniref:G-protein coupled receptors family 1 profile domain-containing protein n=1 Tax=Steinernema hermaphroditum TaxID=289476 RepID=A0AA39I5P6_9BILA|nr:hypothetical protein QR680_013494 [Steinernema hermaphroditum]